MQNPESFRTVIEMLLADLNVGSTYDAVKGVEGNKQPFIRAPEKCRFCRNFLGKRKHNGAGTAFVFLAKAKQAQYVLTMRGAHLIVALTLNYQAFRRGFNALPAAGSWGVPKCPLLVRFLGKQKMNV